MTQLEKIRSMSAEALARWLLEKVERQQQISQDACMHACLRLREMVEAEENGEDFDDTTCTEEMCLAAAVTYLNSEVKEK